MFLAYAIINFSNYLTYSKFCKHTCRIKCIIKDYYYYQWCNNQLWSLYFIDMYIFY